MNPAETQQKLRALISLLDEPDNNALGFINNQILSYGSEAILPLEEAWENTFDTTLQERIENIIHSIQQEALFHELSNWANFGHADLIRGCYLVAKFQFPSLKQETVSEAINKIRKDIWLELNNDLTSLEKIKVLNHILYGVHKFEGVKIEEGNLQPNHINILLESHKGYPVSLGALYIILAQSLDLPVYGVDLPQHFIVAYTRTPVDEKKPLMQPSDVLFYINPNSKGAVFTLKQIEYFLRQMKITQQPSHYLPCNNRVIIRRMMNEMLQSLISSGPEEKLNEFKALMSALD
jgi:regulator of sirC expression with transglutaminase-like and TPR domain